MSQSQPPPPLPLQSQGGVVIGVAQQQNKLSRAVTSTRRIFSPDPVRVNNTQLVRWIEMDRVNTEGQHTEQREKCKQQSWMGNILTWSVSVFSVSLSIELSAYIPSGTIRMPPQKRQLKF